MAVPCGNVNRFKMDMTMPSMRAQGLYLIRPTPAIRPGIEETTNAVGMKVAPKFVQKKIAKPIVVRLRAIWSQPTLVICFRILFIDCFPSKLFAFIYKYNYEILFGIVKCLRGSLIAAGFRLSQLAGAGQIFCSSEFFFKMNRNHLLFTLESP